jgi:chemotaxis protein MotB
MGARTGFRLISRRNEMQRHDRRNLIGAILILIAGSLGCVSQGTYNEVQADRDQLSNRVQALERENAASEEELAELRARSAAIEDELRDEVVAGQILVKQVQDGIQVDVSNQLLFASGSAILSEKGRDVLLRLAKQLREGDETISVEGHTDNVMIGAALERQYPSNWELAGARAARVVRRLSAEGVDPKRLRAVSHGPFDPEASNDTEAGRAQNRRTQILLRPAAN